MFTVYVAYDDEIKRPYISPVSVISVCEVCVIFQSIYLQRSAIEMMDDTANTSQWNVTHFTLRIEFSYIYLSYDRRGDLESSSVLY